VNVPVGFEEVNQRGTVEGPAWRGTYWENELGGAGAHGHHTTS